MSEKHVINFWVHARELYAHLKEFHIHPDHPVEREIMIKAIEDLLIDLAYSIIYETRDKRMTPIHMTEMDAYERFEKASMLEAGASHTVFMDTILMDQLLTMIHSIVSTNPWGIWYVNRSYLEYLGDFRIIQWESEHLVNGEYSAIPVYPTNAE
jgi:hypothetical protein